VVEDDVSTLRGVDCFRNAVAAAAAAAAVAVATAATAAATEKRRPTATTRTTTTLRMAISWTGGKDCHLALQRTLDHVVDEAAAVVAEVAAKVQVVCLVVFCTPDHTFSAHRLEWQAMQAQALDIPLVISHLHLPAKHGDDVCDYALAYATAIGKLQHNHQIDYIVTGDVDYVGGGVGANSTNFLQQDVCRGPHCDLCRGVQVLLPLWQQSRLDLLHEMLNLYDFEIIFSCVKSPYLDDSWIGQRLDLAAIQAMEKSNQRVQQEQARAAAAVVATIAVDAQRPRPPLDLSGENGEYHTMVLNGPMYRRRCACLRLENATSKELRGQMGQDSGERWWVLDEAKARFRVVFQQQQQQQKHSARSEC
jgi:diphthine-ammonia ligase